MERLVLVVLQGMLAKASFVADADLAARLSVLIIKIRVTDAVSPWKLACLNKTLQLYPFLHRTLPKLYSRVSKRLVFDIRKVVHMADIGVVWFGW
jgi:hypothetical protein